MEPGRTRARPLQAVVAEYDKHFHRLFGGRWASIRTALLRNPEHACLVNKFCEEGPPWASEAAPAAEEVERLDLSLWCYSKRSGAFDVPTADASGILSHYLLDGGSLLAVEALQVLPADEVLDMCAAPGGKAVAIMQKLQPALGGQLWCNDVSPDRCLRLQRVIGQYVPRTHARALWVTHHDATIVTSFPRRFTKVLVDAPCSTDRHLLHDREELGRWSAKTPLVNAQRQAKLLATAVMAARAPARIVYSTCALDWRENDGVVLSILRKFPELVSVAALTQLPFGRPTPAGGWIVLPDVDTWGPLYFCALKVSDGSAEGPGPHAAAPAGSNPVAARGPREVALGGDGTSSSESGTHGDVRDGSDSDSA